MSIKNPVNTIIDAKRMIGKMFTEKEVQEDAKLWPFKVKGDPNGRVVIQVLEDGKEKEYDPETISSIILASLKIQAEKYLGHEVKDAVITVPAYFNQAQRSATVDAGKIAGLNVLRIINEPTAASLAFEVDKKSPDDRYIMVFDFGGGTFDVSILCVGDGTNEVRATAGDSHLGGQDIDAKLVQTCIDLFKDQTGIDISKDKYALHRLRKHCERAKRELSTQHTYTITIINLAQQRDFEFRLTRDNFDQISKEIFERLMIPVEKVLADSKKKKEEIDEIILVGGSTRIPKVRQMIKEYFG